MTMIATEVRQRAGGVDRDRIVRFMAGCSIEATRPSAADAARLGELLAPGTQVFVAALPGQAPGEAVEYARNLRRAGLTPTPHIAARGFASLAACDALVDRLAGEAGVTSVMLIGGDLAKPVGAVDSAARVLDSGLLARRGIVSVGIAGYPEPHPQIEDSELEAALVTKLASAQSQGLEAFVVTQFSFDEEVALRFVRWMRERGLQAPVRVGMAGPTSITAWLGYAKRCGVRASAGALAKRAGLVGRLFKAVTPDPIITRFARAADTRELGDMDVSAHLFSFGGVVDTARWLNAVQAGRIVLDGEGFRVATQ